MCVYLQAEGWEALILLGLLERAKLVDGNSDPLVQQYFTYFTMVLL
jgi:hypothetical protein